MALQVWLPLNTENKFVGRGLQKNVFSKAGNPVYSANGKFGGCYKFDGSDDNFYFAVSDKSWWSGKEISYAVWFKSDKVKSSGTIIDLFADLTLSYSYDANGVHFGYWRAWSNNGTRTGDGQMDSNYYSADSWHHIVATFKNQYNRIYVDGQLSKEWDSSSKYTTNWSPLLAATSYKNIAIGRSYGSTSFIGGFVNDARIYDHCLSPKEVQDIYLGKVFEFSSPWKKFGEISNIGDASGIKLGLTPYNLSVSGSSMYFNGSSSYVQFNGLGISGGTVSAWINVAAKPTSQRIIYCDPSSKMIVGFLANGNILASSRGVSTATYQTTGITWGQMTHVVAVWNSGYVQTALYINGVQPATASTSDWWTNSGNIASIGRRLGSGTADYLNGFVNKIEVFATQLTAADVQALYQKGPSTNSWNKVRPMWSGLSQLNDSGCTWIRLLHHNTPATKLFTTGNRKNHEEADLFSKLYLYDYPNLLKLPDGTFEFMAKEKLLSSSTEQTFRWRQTSNPTAATCTGYLQLANSAGVNRAFGLASGPVSNTLFSNKNGWWCACGCNLAYQGGIPGFGDVVKTGYMDLYARIDGTDFGAYLLPNDYQRLEYIESTGTSYINTGTKFNPETDSCKLTFKGSDTSNNGMMFASNGGKYFWLYYYSAGINIYADNGSGQQNVAGITRDLNKHSVEWRGKHYYIDGTDKGTLSNSYTETTNNIWLFSYGSNGYPFKGRIYYAEICRSGVLNRVFIPAKRKSDGAVGMYDLVNSVFYQSNNTAFIAGPEI